jgi:hypothetical protein
LLSNNLDTVGHSQVCHPIQDRALKHQFFELIINPTSLQPIAEDCLETEDLSLRQAPAMIVALSLPLFTPDFSDAPQILVAGVTLRLAVGMAPYPGAPSRRDRCPSPIAIERVVTSTLIVGSVGADLLYLSGRILKHIGQGFGVADIVRTGHNADDFQRRFIHAEVEFRYVAFFFIARKAYHVTSSATFHSDSCNKADHVCPTRALFTNRVSCIGGRRTVKDFQIAHLPLNRFYPYPLPTKHQFFHLGVIAEISVL